jgi:L-asparaginase / beta-aspartyl-peptidase
MAGGRGATQLIQRYAIAVHGGCGRWQAVDTTRALRGVRAALATGRRILADGGHALDAVCAAVVILEDDPQFNAGTGSVLNRDGQIEMDASVMTGRELRCGGVAAIRRVKNPILVARSVMETTTHVLLGGGGALAFARRKGFADYDPTTAARRAGHRRAALASRLSAAGTVGAVARDATGEFAAATSTGGVTFKLRGRIGDSPIPGAGNYATPVAAASATGHGELMLRTLATKRVCDLVAAGKSARVAAQLVIAGLPAAEDHSAGMIAIDDDGHVGIAIRGGTMPHAWFVQGDARVRARMRFASR